MRKHYIILVSIIMLFSTPVFGFGGNTHLAITRSACVATKMFDKFGNLEEKIKLKETLMGACNLPDEEESGWLFKRHFYNPMPTKIDKIEDLITTNDNALKCVFVHYNRAIKCFDTNKTASIKELGMALHYMQDSCCPVHVLGWSNLKHNRPVSLFERKHDEYERKMDEQSFAFEYDLFYEKEKIDFKKAISIQEILNSYPLAAWYDYCELKQIEPTYKVFKNAHEASCKLIYLFFREVGIE